MSEPPAPPLAMLTIESGVDRLAEVRAFVREQAARLEADDEGTADLVQAVDELVCNVVEHGYAGGPGTIEVASLVAPGEIAFRIRDAAPPFDPRSFPAPDLDLPLARRRLGGMGVHLARTLTDGMDHRILPTGGNEVTVRKRLRSTVSEGTSDGHHDGSTER
jgi:serine/threonine-protein kinase RsbW